LLHPYNGGARLENFGCDIAIKVEIFRVDANQAFIKNGNHIDVDKALPLVYIFWHYVRLADHEFGKTIRA
jgi:hypothetical protein